MELMKREKKKRPSDYPQMAFRVSEEDKQRLTDLIGRVHRLANKGAAEDDKKTKKNELIAAALFVGLQTLKNKYSR
jgi:hypothetical protein